MNKPRTFEDALDECLERLLVKNETIEQCLQSFPQYSDRLKPLLETVLATRQVSAVRPRAEFRERARQQFKSALQETERQKSRVSFSWGWQPGWAIAVAIVLILSLAGGGTVYAAAGSMPDSSLYTVKRAAEQVQMALTFSELGKAELHAKLADKRVTEIVYLSDKDKPEKLARITENMNSHLTEITALVSTPEMVSVPVAPATQPATAAEPPSAPTQAPAAPTVAAPPQPAAAERAPSIKPQEEPASKATPLQEADENKSKEASVKVDRRAKLKTTVENQANSNTARLRVLLETAPESAKPALRKALDQSETEYKKAIEALN